MATIHSPVSGFTGPGPGDVRFVAGQAETSNPRVLAYARRHGYRIEQPTPAPRRTRKPREEEQPDAPQLRHP